LYPDFPAKLFHQRSLLSCHIVFIHVAVRKLPGCFLSHSYSASGEIIQSVIVSGGRQTAGARAVQTLNRRFSSAAKGNANLSI
ncbi:hypothetical protein, partial [Bacillus paralicheniformis]|uniref:hypothetical protein n=1 Tax=Bacillus paralicheniformis TaxID=1648923 RepID=UPI001C957A89